MVTHGCLWLFLIICKVTNGKKRRDNCGVQLPRRCDATLCWCWRSFVWWVTERERSGDAFQPPENPTIEYHLTTSTNLSTCRLVTVGVLLLLWNEVSLEENVQFEEEFQIGCWFFLPRSCFLVFMVRFSAPSSPPLSSNEAVCLDHKPLCRYSPLRCCFGSE